MLKGQPKAHIWQLLKSLRELLIQHCHDEENVMHKAIFPDAEEHHQIHGRLIAKSDELAKQDQLTLEDLFHFLAHDVVIQHLLIEDRKFFPYINPNFPIDPHKSQEPSGSSDAPATQMHVD